MRPLRKLLLLGSYENNSKLDLQNCTNNQAFALFANPFAVTVKWRHSPEDGTD